ncbi:protein kinase [Myxococcota bacterium]|nr:protein kinase [Myxococcota bacterium]
MSNITPDLPPHAPLSSPTGEQVLSATEVDDPRPSDTFLGRRIGDLHLVSCIGEGGFGTVYRAENQASGTSFAVKVLHAKHLDKSVMVKRFEREARTIARLDHPNVIRVTDFGQFEDGSHYLVMELLEGFPLDDWLEQRRSLSIALLESVLKQIGSALSYVHQHGVIHRDLKPANLFLSFEFGQKSVRCKLLDFGIAGLSDEPGLTKTGAVLGSPLYMSPEQIEGHAKKADARTDLYSFGVIVFHLLAGLPPYVSNDMMSVLFNHLHAPIPRLKDVRPAFSWSPSIEVFFQKALAKAPQDRYPNADAFVDACLRALTAQRELTPDATFPQYPLGNDPLITTLQPKSRRVRFDRQSVLLLQRKLAAQKRNLFWAAFLALLFVGVGAFGAWYKLRARKQAETEPLLIPQPLARKAELPSPLSPQKDTPSPNPSNPSNVTNPPDTTNPSNATNPSVPSNATNPPNTTNPSSPSVPSVQTNWPMLTEVVVSSDIPTIRARANGKRIVCPPCSFKGIPGTPYRLRIRARGYRGRRIKGIFPQIGRIVHQVSLEKRR